MFKIIVAGSRTFTDYKLLEEKLDQYLSDKDPKEIIIVSGTANGADKLGEEYALKHNLICKQFPADWNTFGKSAGYRRNEQMAIYADALVAFWDGHSRGTMHMINLMRQHGDKVRVVNF